jgi:hypothetical protein
VATPWRDGIVSEAMPFKGEVVRGRSWFSFEKLAAFPYIQAVHSSRVFAANRASLGVNARLIARKNVPRQLLRTFLSQ